MCFMALQSTDLGRRCRRRRDVWFIHDGGTLNPERGVNCQTLKIKLGTCNKNQIASEQDTVCKCTVWELSYMLRRAVLTGRGIGKRAKSRLNEQRLLRNCKMFTLCSRGSSKNPQVLYWDERTWCENCFKVWVWCESCKENPEHSDLQENKSSMFLFACALHVTRRPDHF